MQSSAVTTLEMGTPHGPARAHMHLAAGARVALVLGHGAGGGVGSRDLTTAAEAALAEGLSVALVEQPYRVAGRRSPAPAGQLDTAWTTVLGELREGPLVGLAVVVGGRSSGARVACRTSAEVGAAGVLCLAFPLVPPGRRSASPPRSRLGELDAVTVPTLVVQGVRDPFGMPPPGPRRTVAQVQADHSLRTDLGSIAEAVATWLRQVVG